MHPPNPDSQLAAAKDYEQSLLRQLERGAIHLHPGQVGVTRDRSMTTLLGSCVSVCLYDARIQLMGMNHFLRPRVQYKMNATESNLSGMAALDTLVNAMMKQGAQRSRLQAKVFGGAHVLSVMSRFVPGDHNIRFAQDWLAAELIPVLAADLGGQRARKIVADPLTGMVHCRYIGHTPEVKALLRRSEIEYARKLKHDLAARRIDFFES